jgi:cytochrome c biogenesis protein CcdA
MYSAGIAIIFGALGAIAVVLGRAFLDLAPVLIVLAGTFLIATGTIRLATTSFGFQLGLLSKLMGQKYGSFSRGVNFGIASFGCSAPVLFALVGYGLARGGLATSLAAVLLYVLAMIIPILLLSIFRESARQTLSGIKRLLPLTEKLGIILPVVVGVYLIGLYYYAYFPFLSR